MSEYSHKGLILSNTYNKYPEVNYQINRLWQEFNELGVVIDIKDCNGLIAHLSDQVVTDGFNYDFIVYLDKDKYISLMLEKVNIPIFNNAAAIEICDDKMLTYIALANQGIKMPTTISGPLCYQEKAVDLPFLAYVEDVLGLPLVIKECYGSSGKQVYLINSRQELIEKAQQLILKPHLFQKYIASSYGKDIRVIVINHRAVAWMLRQSTNDFRSNVALGGSGYKMDLPIEYQVMAESASRLLSLDYAGVDLLIGDMQEPILCEVNSNAFFSEMEKTTAVNVGGLYAKHIYQRIYLK